MDRDAALSDVTKRYALRRAACLRLLDVEAEVQALLDREQARRWDRVLAQHDDEFVRLHGVVVEEYRQKSGRDQPSSAFVGWAIHREAHLRFVDYLSRKGHTKPSHRSTGSELDGGTPHADGDGPLLRPDTGTV